MRKQVERFNQQTIFDLRATPFRVSACSKQTGPDADGGNFAQDEGSFAQVRCKISSTARGGGVMLVQTNEASKAHRQ